MKRIKDHVGVPTVKSKNPKKPKGAQPFTSTEPMEEDVPKVEKQEQRTPADKQEITDAITILLATNQPMDYQKLADELRVPMFNVRSAHANLVKAEKKLEVEEADNPDQKLEALEKRLSDKFEVQVSRLGKQITGERYVKPPGEELLPDEAYLDSDLDGWPIHGKATSSSLYIYDFWRTKEIADNKLSEKEANFIRFLDQAAEYLLKHKYGMRHVLIEERKNRPIA